MTQPLDRLPAGVLEPASLEAWLKTLPENRLFYKGDEPKDWEDDSQDMLLCYMWNAVGVIYDVAETCLIERGYDRVLVMPDWLQEFRDRVCFSHGNEGTSVKTALLDLEEVRSEFDVPARAE